MKYLFFLLPLAFAAALVYILYFAFGWHATAMRDWRAAKERGNIEAAKDAQADLIAIRCSIALVIIFVGALCVLAIGAITELL